MRYLVVVLLVAAGCSQKVYAPPSQLFAVTPIAALPETQQALDIDVSRHAQIFDPPVDAADGRLRVGLGNDTEASIEGTAAAVTDSGTSNASRTFYTGRAGVRTNPDRGAFTFFAGAGGGYAAAGGSFISADGGLAVGYVNCVLVPTAQASAYVSKPIDPQPIDVTTDEKHPTYDTPSTTLGGVLRVGVRVSLSPAACRRGEQSAWLVGGVGVTKMVDQDSDAAIPGVGLGIEIPLTD
ncbi:MAG TPA: hypothetical protein VIV40_12975 [Kofleriaceae bacterium]